MNQNQSALLKLIYESSFAMIDTILFLDTHPDCMEALSYYQKMKHIYKQAVSDYQEHYGPLFNSGVNTCSDWKWIEQPWPWECPDRC